MENKIRNVAILGHMASGKTTLVEALASECIGKEMGSIEKKNTISDYLDEERQRGSSIKSSIIPLNFKDYKINLIDLPGNDDFIQEAIGTISVVKGAILVINAQNGVEEETIKHYNMLKKRNIPTIIYVNKMDKDGIKFESLLEDIKLHFGSSTIPFCYPMGHDNNFDGFINVVELKARKYNGKTCDDAEIYPDKRKVVFELHNQMVEAVAESSEELMEKFFAGEDLTKEEIRLGLRDGVLNGRLIPVLVGSALKKIGIHTLLSMLIDYLPNPSDLKPLKGIDDDGKEVLRKTLDSEEFSAFVFKTNVDPYAGITNIFKVNSGTLHIGDTVYDNLNKANIEVNNLNIICGATLKPVSEVHAGDIGAITKVSLSNGVTLSSLKSHISYPLIEYPSAVYYKAIKPHTKNDEDKLSTVISKVILENPTVKFVRNSDTHEQLIGSLGTGHLNYIIQKMKTTYKLNLDLTDYKISYRETIKTSATGSGRYIKQSGGSGFFGVVEMRFEPDQSNSFSEEVFGGAVPKNYFPAVEKGFNEACQKGLLKGYPVIGVHAVLTDGKYHPVDSNEVAFKNAAILAFKDAYMKAKPVLLEPIMKIVVTASSELVGDILSDLNTRRAKIVGMDINSIGQQKLEALVPESEIIEYVNDLKSITKGRAYFNREFYGYDVVPSNIDVPNND